MSISCGLVHLRFVLNISGAPHRPVRLLLWEGVVFSVDVGVGIVVQLQQLSQGRHARIRIHQHRGQAGGVPLDAAGPANRCEELQIFNAALSPGPACAGLLFNCPLDTEQNI